MHNNRKHKNKNFKRSGKFTERSDKLVESGMTTNKNSITILPKINVSPTYTYIRRYIFTSGTQSSITIQSLIETMIFAATTVLGYSPFIAIRMKKIRLLAPVTTQGTTVTIWLRPNPTNDSTNNNFNALPETFVDTSASIDKPAYLAIKTSLDTPMGSWHATSTVNSTLCTLSVPPGTTLDLLLEAVPNVGATTVGFTATIAAATVGNVYCRNLMVNGVPVGINAI